MPVAETFDAMLSGQRSLVFADFGDTKIIKSKIRGQMRLIMAFEKWFGLRDVGPFGKAFAPPRVVLRDRMKLRKVKGNETNLRILFRIHVCRVRRGLDDRNGRANLERSLAILQDLDSVIAFSSAAAFR